jgi:VanZ family protein
MSHPVRRAWVPALLWLLVIAWESTSLMSAANTGRFLFVVIRFFVPHVALSQLELLNAVGRKVGHCFGYAVLSLLMLRAWWSTLLLPRWAKRLPALRLMLRCWSARAAAAALLSTAAVAALDEWHQAFLPSRTGTLHDVVLDTMAAISVQLIAIAFSDARGRQVALSGEL